MSGIKRFNMTAKCPSCNELTEHFKIASQNAWDSEDDLLQCGECGERHRREILVSSETKVPMSKVWPIIAKNTGKL